MLFYFNVFSQLKFFESVLNKVTIICTYVKYSIKINKIVHSVSNKITFLNFLPFKQQPHSLINAQKTGVQ